MKANLLNFYILTKRFIGNRLTITFQHETDIHFRCELVLTEVVGFRDYNKSDKLHSVRIDDDGSSFALDLSLQLKRPEIVTFHEIYLFAGESRSVEVFRACAKIAEFRQLS